MPSETDHIIPINIELPKFAISYSCEPPESSDFVVVPLKPSQEEMAE
jgi:hypothetical protein